MRFQIVLAGLAAVIGVASAANAAATPEQKCQAAKLKAHGKFAACKKRALSASIVKGEDLEALESACRAKFDAAIQKASDKATAAGISPCRYLNHGDGTGLDLNTGLMWEIKTNDGTIHDSSHTYTWSTGGLVYLGNGSAFTVFLANLNYGTGGDTTEGCFAGYCDWRLPSIEELEQASNCIPPIFSCYDPFDSSVSVGAVWSNTSGGSSPSAAFLLHPDDGLRSTFSKTSTAGVRAVRGGL